MDTNDSADSSRIEMIREESNVSSNSTEYALIASDLVKIYKKRKMVLCSEDHVVLDHLNINVDKGHM